MKEGLPRLEITTNSWRKNGIYKNMFDKQQLEAAKGQSGKEVAE